MIELGSRLFSDFNYRWIAEDMHQNLPAELDLKIEAANIQKVTKLLDPKLGIWTPNVYSNLSTSWILVMEFVNGFSLTDLDKLW